MSRINVTIDQLVLRGFEPSDGEAVAEGLKSELSRVLSDPTVRAQRAQSHRTPLLRLRTMASESGVSGRRKFGAGMAQQIAKRLQS
jgi:hypothetical protein